MSMCYAHLKSGDFRRQGLARGVPLEPPQFEHLSVICKSTNVYTAIEYKLLLCNLYGWYDRNNQKRAI